MRLDHPRFDKIRRSALNAIIGSAILQATINIIYATIRTNHFMITPSHSNSIIHELLDLWKDLPILGHECPDFVYGYAKGGGNLVNPFSIYDAEVQLLDILAK